MKNIALLVKLELYRIWYKFIKIMVVQAEYMGCRILVRAEEDVGIQILAGNYEKNDLLYLLSEIQDGDVFLDIGANIGLFSVVAAKKNSSIKIHAFEPIPVNACLFEASIHLNGIKSIKLNRCCVGNVVGKIEFSLASDSAYSSIHDTGRMPEIDKIITEITILDRYCEINDLKRVDIMKIDVEGAEKLVLDGAQNLFSKHNRKPRLVLMELYDENFKIFNTSIDEVIKVMQHYGYKAFVVEGNQRHDYHSGLYKKYYNVFFECCKSDDA
jgi:FkbM family methyltransferase